MHSRGIQSTPETFQSMVEGYCTRGSTHQAVELLSQTGVPILAESVHSLIQGYLKEGCKMSITDLYSKVQKLSPGSFDQTTTFLLLQYAVVKGEMGVAENLYAYMEEQSFVIKISTYNLLFEGYFKVGQFDKISQLLSNMGTRLAKNRSTFAILITNYAAAGLNKEALEIFEEMKHVGKYPATPFEREAMQSCSATESKFPPSILQTLQQLVPQFNKGA